MLRAHNNRPINQLIMSTKEQSLLKVLIRYLFNADAKR